MFGGLSGLIATIPAKQAEGGAPNFEAVRTDPDGESTYYEKNYNEDIDMNGNDILNAGTVETDAVKSGQQLTVAGAKQIARSTHHVVRGDGAVFSFGTGGDYADIGAAYNAAMEAGAVVYLPPGEYSYSTTMEPAEWSKTAGAGQWQTGLKYSGTAAGIKIYQVSGVRIDGLSIINTSGDGYGLELFADSEPLVKTTIRNFGVCGGTHGIFEHETNSGQIWDLDYYNVHIADVGDHAYHSDGAIVERRCVLLKQSVASAFYDQFGGTTNHNGQISGDFIHDRGSSWNVQFERIMAEHQVKGSGIVVKGASQFTLCNSNFEWAEGFSQGFVQNCKNFSILNNKFIGGNNYGGAGLRMANSITNGFVHGNIMTGSGGGDGDVRLGGGDYSTLIFGANEVGDSIVNPYRMTIDMASQRFGRYEVVSANTTATSEQTVVLVDTNAEAVTVTISSGATAAARQLTVVDIGGNASSNAITLAGDGSSIKGKSSITTNYGQARLVSDGEDWFGW
jgi:hypothetical protein